MAEEAGLDLVEIVPNAEPPVCKIVDLGKLKYQNQKKASETRKKQKTVEITGAPDIDEARHLEHHLMLMESVLDTSVVYVSRNFKQSKDFRFCW